MKGPLPSPNRSGLTFVSVSLLGYQTQQQAVHAGQTLRFEMEPQVFSLKEVEIRPGRVWGRQDTINYDVTRFLPKGSIHQGRITETSGYRYR